jgi:hypothetical protein
VKDSSATAADAVQIHYARPVLSWISQSWYYTNGSSSVTILGSQFGPTLGNIAPVTFGNFEAQNCKVTLAHTRMVCDVGEAYGLNHYWHATICGQRSLPSDFSISFYAPIIDQLEVAWPVTLNQLQTAC